MNKNQLKITILFIFVAAISSCNRNKKPDLSNNTIEITIQRFDEDLFEPAIENLGITIKSLKTTYPHFFPLYNHAIVEIGSSQNPAYPDMLTQFMSNFSVYKAYEATKNSFTDMSTTEKELGKAFSYYNYYFPNRPIPEVVSFIGGFNQSVVTEQELIGIGLDKYLGSDHEIYQMMNPPYPDYFLYRMQPDNIPIDCMKGWLYAEFPFNDSINNLVNNIIYEGMIAYSLEKTMPDVNDTLLFGFTPEQLTFCENNELQMWTYLIENKLLFVSDNFIIRQFIGEAPFTKGFSPESPGKSVQWLGRQIIRSYVKKNKIADLNELMNRKDYLKILNSSGYNP